MCEGGKCFYVYVCLFIYCFCCCWLWCSFFLLLFLWFFVCFLLWKFLWFFVCFVLKWNFVEEVMVRWFGKNFCVKRVRRWWCVGVEFGWEGRLVDWLIDLRVWMWVRWEWWGIRWFVLVEGSLRRRRRLWLEGCGSEGIGRMGWLSSRCWYWCCSSSIGCRWDLSVVCWIGIRVVVLCC